MALHVSVIELWKQPVWVKGVTPLVSPKWELHSYKELEERGTQPDILCWSPSITMREVLVLP